MTFIRAAMKPILNSIAIAAVSSSLATATDFLAPFEHIHASKSGTPYVHAFGIEPAFTGRDLFIDHTFIEGDGFTEHESEIELEWAFTKRLGVIVEVPYIYEDVEGVGTTKGFGDLAIVPRALIIESDRFLLTAQVETVLPTGSSSFGGDTAIAPGISMWNDLENNFTLNSIVSIEHGFDADETELVYGVGLVKSFGENHAVRTNTAAALACYTFTSKSPEAPQSTAPTKVTSISKVLLVYLMESPKTWTSALLVSPQSPRRMTSTTESPPA